MCEMKKEYGPEIGSAAGMGCGKGRMKEEHFCEKKTLKKKRGPCDFDKAFAKIQSEYRNSEIEKIVYDEDVLGAENHDCLKSMHQVSVFFYVFFIFFD